MWVTAAEVCELCHTQKTLLHVAPPQPLLFILLLFSVFSESGVMGNIDSGLRSGAFHSYLFSELLTSSTLICKTVCTGWLGWLASKTSAPSSGITTTLCFYVDAEDLNTGPF